MEKDDRKAGTGQVNGSPEPQHAPRPAPGRVTRTSRLETGQAPAAQRKPGEPRPASAREATGTAETRDLYMDMAFRGSTALAERGLTLDDLPVSPGAGSRTLDEISLASHRSQDREPAIQRKLATTAAGATTPARSPWDPTMDPSMDAAHRGGTALQEAGLAAVQQSAATPAASPVAAPAAPPAATSAAPPATSIDPPRPGIDKPGFIDNDDGANLRTGPAELQGVTLTARPLPPATRVFVSGQHPRASEWWYVTAFLPGTIVRGYVQHFRVNTDLPEPTARLYQLQPGDTAEQLAVQEFSAEVRDGHDLRYYENVLLAVNRDKGRAGIRGTFQEPGILGGGADNIQLEAGRRIWLVSPAYARALEGVVPDGSLTGGLHARARRVLGHVDDLVQSATDSPQYFGAVAGEYADAIKDHLPEIIGITAGFILAESASAFLAATPTGVGQLAAVVIQLGLAAFGAKFAIDAGVQAQQHGEQWLTLAWTAHGDPEQLAAASREFLKMLVSIAMAALTIAGVRANAGKGLKVASAIEIRPPMLGWSPAMATAGGGVMPGGPVLTPGSIASAGPVDIGGPSLMSATGAGAGKAKAESGPSQGQPERRDVGSHEDAGGHTGERHVGKSESWLRQRLANDPDLDVASSFRNEVAANRTQGAFVKRYREQIDAWLASGDRPFTGKIDMGQPIGIVMNSSGRVVETSRALLVLVRDSSAQGWHFLTSYPIP